MGLANVYCNANFSVRDSNLGIHAEVRKHPARFGSSMVGYG